MTETFEYTGAAQSFVVPADVCEVTVDAYGAEGGDAGSARIGDVLTSSLTTVTPDAPIDEAARIMRDNALRRLPVVEDGTAVGIVSLGDLAVRADPNSALGGISSARPNA